MRLLLFVGITFFLIAMAAPGAATEPVKSECTWSRQDLAEIDAMSSSMGNAALNDCKFRAEIREYFAVNNGERYYDDGKLIDAFYRQQAFNRQNWVVMATRWEEMSFYERWAENERSKTRDTAIRLRSLAIRMDEVYESLPAFWEEDGRGWKGFWHNLFAWLLDFKVVLLGLVVWAIWVVRDDRKPAEQKEIEDRTRKLKAENRKLRKKDKLRRKLQELEDENQKLK